MSASYLKLMNLNKNKMNTDIILLDHIDKENDNYKEYYCAYIVEKLFECENKLTYIKGGGFGLNYRYCASCYTKWNKLQNEPKKPVGKYLGVLPKDI